MPPQLTASNLLLLELHPTLPSPSAVVDPTKPCDTTFVGVKVEDIKAECRRVKMRDSGSRFDSVRYLLNDHLNALQAELDACRSGTLEEAKAYWTIRIFHVYAMMEKTLADGGEELARLVLACGPYDKSAENSIRVMKWLLLGVEAKMAGDSVA
ncbi:uncharacterized protein L3040_007473 [Drepanopeziza brunnea f. sp. 'multigermtubi']|uniref:Uncharacterized protein n=1 Tax=Marssonina brunnea f. sp. multigermtubi (strain MB_m1) TaxID=1072389 RepID=K1XCL5_MARBU|nr:uncharacterized protein MBM_03496 [Drepanopeziza brunnea f. sp. 'multigermtubi' MB_m1]EKD18503.1 hypothetical protein MBM_03496 [Drepanopeziza brunnea f. sp. 'multigermtubi' MB_m1]KAJ5037296.1 hypothetical protein L3040_007473 [Drepanopeziza brunnea f. sp. 'multigermtubi']